MEYVNKRGIEFSIEVREATVPADADYWGFRVRATETATRKACDFQALFLKETFPTKEQAALFLDGDPMQFLKSKYLEQYSNGRHDMLWPVIHDGWVVC